MTVAEYIEKLKLWTADLETLPQDAQLFGLGEMKVSMDCESAEEMGKLSRAIGGKWTKSEFWSFITFKQKRPSGEILLWCSKDCCCKRTTEIVHIPTVDAQPAVPEHDEEVVKWECPESILALSAAPPGERSET